MKTQDQKTQLWLCTTSRSQFSSIRNSYLSPQEQIAMFFPPNSPNRSLSQRKRNPVHVHAAPVQKKYKSRPSHSKFKQWVLAGNLGKAATRRPYKLKRCLIGTALSHKPNTLILMLIQRISDNRIGNRILSNNTKPQKQKTIVRAFQFQKAHLEEWRLNFKAKMALRLEKFICIKILIFQHKTRSRRTTAPLIIAYNKPILLPRNLNRPPNTLLASKKQARYLSLNRSSPNKKQVRKSSNKTTIPLFRHTRSNKTLIQISIDLSALQ